MHEYEIFIEDINPCGGEQYSKKTLIEAEAASPEAYVKEKGRFPFHVIGQRPQGRPGARRCAAPQLCSGKQYSNASPGKQAE